MTPVHGTETSEGRLGAVLRLRGPDPVALGRHGPWVVTTLAHARTVWTQPETFDFPFNVSREQVDRDRQTQAPHRSPHTMTPALDAQAVERGSALFRSELTDVMSGWRDDQTIDAMDAFRLPVARSSTAAVLPALPVTDRNRISELVLDWIDALGPVIASSMGPLPWSRKRRREHGARERLHEALRTHGHDDPSPVATMLAAGIQVPTAASAWLCCELAAHPDVARDVGRAPESAMAVVWETLRLCPPTWITARITTEEVQLGAVRIPAGMVVMVSPLLLGRDEALVPGPAQGQPGLDVFWPRRWRDGASRPGAWLPFGAGPHACPGRNLGLAQLLCLSQELSGVRLSLAGRVAVNQTRGIFPAPAKIRVQRLPM